MDFLKRAIVNLSLIAAILLGPPAFAKDKEPKRYSWGSYALSIPAAAVLGFGSGQALQNRWRSDRETCFTMCTGVIYTVVDGLSAVALANAFIANKSGSAELGLLGFFVLAASRAVQLGDVIVAPILIGFPSAQIDDRYDPLASWDDGKVPSISLGLSINL